LLRSKQQIEARGGEAANWPLTVGLELMKGALRRSSLSLLKCTGLLWSPPRDHFGRENVEKFAILCYHRVSDSQDANFLPPDLTCSESRFREHMSMFERHFSVLSLDEAFSTVRAGEALPPRTVALTFDDCWYENMETVAQPLAKARIPATFFISSGNLDSEELHPNHRFYYLLSRSELENITRALVSMFPKAQEQLPIQASARKIRLWLESELGCTLVSDEGKAVMDSLEKEPGVASSVGRGRGLNMTSDQVRSLPDYGIEIGNHTLSHRQLSTMNESEQRRDIEEGQNVLAALAGHDVKAFAYPYGERGDFDETSVKVVKDLGNSYACTTIRGYNDAGTEPMLLHRINAGPYAAEELAFGLLWRGMA